MTGEWLGAQPDLMIPRLESLVADLRSVARGQSPPMLEKAALLDDYLIFQRAVPCLAGRMFDHPDIATGHAGVTSELYFIDVERGVARTFTRWYRLGREGVTPR